MRESRRMSRHLKPYCVDVELRTMAANEDEDGKLHFDWDIVTMSHLIYSKGPEQAVDEIEECMPETDFSIEGVRRVRPSLGERMVVEDEYDPIWDYEQGAIEESMERDIEYP